VEAPAPRCGGHLGHFSRWPADWTTLLHQFRVIENDPKRVIGSAVASDLFIVRHGRQTRNKLVSAEVLDNDRGLSSIEKIAATSEVNYGITRCFGAGEGETPRGSSRIAQSQHRALMCRAIRSVSEEPVRARRRWRTGFGTGNFSGVAMGEPLGYRSRWFRWWRQGQDCEESARVAHTSTSGWSLGVGSPGSTVLLAEQGSVIRLTEFEDLATEIFGCRGFRRR
jgi:hypothetical protein